jgi:hypothetical protein
MVGVAVLKRGLVCVALVVAVCLATSAPSGAVASSLNPGTTASAWSMPQSQAVSAISNYSGAALTEAGPLSSEATSSITSESGESISVEERSFEVAIGGAETQVTLSWLNETQVIADYVNPNSPLHVVSLVLQPGSSTVSSANESTATAVVTPTSTGELQSFEKTKNKFTNADLGSSAHKTRNARLSDFVYAGGCEEYIDPPSTEPTIYGILVYGLGGYVSGSCNGNQALYLNLHFQTTSLNDVVGASGNPDTEGVGTIAYWPCYGVSSFYAWYTGAAYDVFGTFYGYTDGPAFLYCVSGY